MNRFLYLLQWLTGVSAFYVAVFGATCYASQGQTPTEVHNKYLAIVTVKSGDTLASLAQTYLGDARKAWQIAEFNKIVQAVEGRRLVIPLQPLHRGGLDVDGYQCVPVLFYPYIGPGTKEFAPFSTQTFEAQMQHLRTNGYQPISLDQLIWFLNFKEPLAPKAVVLTFDTTHTWVYTLAFPILKKMGFRAAVFVTTAQIDRPNRLSWKQLAEMRKAGFDIGTNGVTGQNLSKRYKDSDPALYLKALEDEISLSQQAITRHLNYKCVYFAYPDGQIDDYFISLLKEYGFKVALTRSPGENSADVNNFSVKRSTVEGKNEQLPFHEHLITFIPAVLK